MRIAFIAPRWDYGDPRRGLSMEEVTFHSALRGMGHDVHHFDYLDRCAAVGPEAMNEELLRFIEQVAPEFAFFVLFKEEIAVETIRRITDSGVVTFNWFADDHWRFDSFSSLYAPAFSLVSTTDAAAVPRYNAIGYDRVILTQWACNRHAFKPPAESDLRRDVSFVGQRYGDRPRIISAIERSGHPVDCYGYGWEGGRLEHEEMVGMFASSRINLNFSKAFRGRLFSRRPLTFQIKARIFEIAGSGGFVLTEHSPELDRYFEPGTEIATFTDRSEAVEGVRHWLSNEEERSAVARRGYERVIRDHTYEHRLERIFAAAGLAGDRSGDLHQGSPGGSGALR